MTLDDFRNTFRNRLTEMYEAEEVNSLCTLTLEHVLDMNRIEVSLSRKMELSPSQLSHLEEVLKMLEEGKPIQYIIGKTEFYGLEFQVNPSTLIPRPETEELIEWILSEMDKAQSGQQILDVGTGSGCIAISLAKNKSNSKVDGIDISKNALATAYQNAKGNQVSVSFFQQDILEVERFDKKYDIIISNPPYVREQEKAQMRENVLANEPDSALFVSDLDPLVFYRKIGELAYESLTKGGMLFFEINEFLGKEMIELLREIGFEHIDLRKDMFGKDRMIKVTRA